MLKQTDYLVSKTHLAKPYPDKNLLKDYFNNAQSYLSETQTLINNTNDLYLKYLNDIANFNVQAVQDVKTIYSLLADLFVLNGNTANSLNVLDLASKVNSNSTVRINTSTNEVKIDGVPYSNSFLTSSLQIKGLTILPKVGQQLSKDIFVGAFGKNANSQVFNILSSVYKLSVYSIDQPLSFSLLIDFGSVMPVNYVSLDLLTEVIPYLTIKSLKATTNNSDLFSLDITNSGSGTATGYEVLETTNGTNSTITIEFDNQLTRYIQVEFQYSNFELINGKRIFELDMNNLVSGFELPGSSGSVIFGPLKFSDQIVKASVQAAIDNYDLASPNVIFSVAPDLSGTWYQLINAIEFNPTLQIKNVVNFNNVSTDSINTTNPVTELYLKIDFTATQVNLSDIISLSNVNVESYISRSRVTIDANNRNIFLGQTITDPASLSVLRCLFGYSGWNAQFPIASQLDTTNLIELNSNGSTFAPSLFSTTKPDPIKGTFNFSAITQVVTKPEKVQLVITEKTTSTPAFGFDQYRIQMSGYSLPIASTINSSTALIKSLNTIPAPSAMVYVLPINSKAGKYKILLNTGDQFVVDLTAKCFFSITETYFQVENSAVTSYTVYSPIGTQIFTGPISTVGQLSYISLFDFLDISIPTVAGYTFNKTYGLTNNSPTQFTVINQGFIFGTYFSGSITGAYKIVQVPITTNYINNNLVLDNPKIVQVTETLTGADYQKIYQLYNTNIIQNSLVFDLQNASINPFITEAVFIDGHTEFNLTETVEIQTSGSENTILLSNFVGDETTNILFDGNTDIFNNRVYSVQELINSGDYCVSNDGSGNWSIILPEGIFTNPIFVTRIIYPTNSVSPTYGLYSVDYINGIIYTTAPLDARIAITYSFSNTFAKYEHLDLLDSELYTVSSNQISIKDSDVVQAGQYLIVYNSLNDLASSTQVYSTPVVNDLILNILTASEVL